jgi:hypothetical protein
MKNNKYLVFVAMGFELVGIIVASVVIGKLIDDRYQLKGLGLIGLSMAGLAGWIYHMVLLAKQLEKVKEDGQ